MNANTTLYLDGKTAYIRRYGVASRRVKKSEFESLIVEADNTLRAIVNRETAEKYSKRINRLGYILKSKKEYDMFTFELSYSKI